MSPRLPTSLQAWRRLLDARKARHAARDDKPASTIAPADATVYAAGIACVSQAGEPRRR